MGVLILDGHCSAALAFVRSLGRAGYFVAVGSSAGSFSPAALSRYCRLRMEYPRPTEGAEKFAESVLDFCRTQSIELIIPMTEVTVRPMAEFAGSFGSFTRIAAPSPDALEAVSDKYGTVVRSNEFNIPVPETLLVHSISDLKATEDWTPPIVVKDRYSVRWCGDKGMIGSTGYAYSRNELVEKVQEKLERVGDVLVQQFTRGVGVGFACLVLEGKITLPFQWLRVREKDPRGSGSSARISLPLQPGIIELSELLLKRASFTGPAMVEFKRELGSEQLTVMEINGRPWGSMQLPIQCGINYPLLLAQWYLDGRLPPERINYHTGITCRSIAADLTHLENLWGGTPLGWPVPYPNFLRSLFKVIIPWYPGLKSEEISWRDPKPGLFQIARWFASHMGGGN